MTDEKNEKKESVYTENQVKTIINSVNNAGMRQYMTSLFSGGYHNADTLHNIYRDFGYPDCLSFDNFWNMYRRNGIAKRAVELYPDQTWLDYPTVDVGAAQKDLDFLIDSKYLWKRLKGLDVRQRVGRYAGLFVRVADGKKPDEELVKLNGVDQIVDMIPLYESQLIVSEIYDDPLHDEYTKPKMYNFVGTAVGADNEKNKSSFNIHPSRIIIASEDSDNSSIYGVPCLESVFNSLMDIVKIVGSGGEGFYRNASQSLVFDVNDPSQASQNEELLNSFNDQFDSFTRDRMRKAMWTPGMTAKTLDSNLVPPKDYFMNTLHDISAGVGIPTSLLIGNQTGRLAGDQDAEGFLSEVQERRKDFGTMIVNNFIDWCMKYGVLKTSDYDIEWSDATAPSDGKKLDNADKMASINQKLFLTGEPLAFSAEEVREKAGYATETMPALPDETDTGDDDI